MKVLSFYRFYNIYDRAVSKKLKYGIHILKFETALFPIII